MRLRGADKSCYAASQYMQYAAAGGSMERSPMCRQASGPQTGCRGTTGGQSRTGGRSGAFAVEPIGSHAAAAPPLRESSNAAQAAHVAQPSPLPLRMQHQASPLCKEAHPSPMLIRYCRHLTPQRRPTAMAGTAPAPVQAAAQAAPAAALAALRARCTSACGSRAPRTGCCCSMIRACRKASARWGFPGVWAIAQSR